MKRGKAQVFAARTLWPGSTQLAPVPAALVGCGGSGGWKENLITVAWTGILSSKPPMLSISLRPERYSWEIIKALGEFTLNLPPASLAADVDWCGVVSGRDHDKFAERGLSSLPGVKVSAPLVGECVLGLECKVGQVLELGSHHAFIAEVLAVRAAEELLETDGRLNLTRDGLLAYAHGHYYTLGECLGHFGFSVRRKPGIR